MASRTRREPDGATAHEETAGARTRRRAGRGTRGTPGKATRGKQGNGVKRTGLRRFFTWRKVLAYVVALGALLVGAFAVLYYLIDIPEANALAKAQSNVYQYSDGTVLARTGDVNRESVPLSRVPKAVQHAFVAAENKTFYDDPGIDPMGVVRGLVNTVTGKGTQGGSTITQQYVKNYYLSQEQTVTRKVKELIISLKVDQRNSKDDILAGYLNTSYFGRVAYGVQAAARAYYDKDVGKLTVAEGAYLAALVQAPSQYDWAVATPTAKRLVTRRWNYVLDNMVEMGWLDAGERQALRFPEPVAPQPARGLGGQAGYLVDAARNELIAAGVSEQELAAGGWTITLTIDPDKQRALERAMKPALRDADTQGAAVSVDPGSGRVVALYGGRDYTKHYLSNATRADYQVGPVFLPVVTATALENKQGTRKGGQAEVKDIAVALGLPPDTTGLTDPQTVSLGLAGASPLRMAGVYATVAHHGERVTPVIVKSARRGDETAGPPGAVGGQALTRATADFLTSELVQNGGGPRAARALARPAAGISGTADDKKAVWHVGYTPDLVTTVAFFGEDAKSRKQIRLKDTRADVPEKVWSAYAREALRGTPASGFDLEGAFPAAVEPNPVLRP
ncbi:MULTISPECIES: transglycosylase domain-containing protein [unclassified Streptomyces]|uniref:transglycosylase domain-containing protein n=1 Tax=unclassified Streptomyces TaxID=2593676 RepID=UPI00336A657B